MLPEKAATILKPFLISLFSIKIRIFCSIILIYLFQKKRIFDIILRNMKIKRRLSL